MTRAAYFNCFSGIAGDMALGALIDTGADLQFVITTLQALNVSGWSVEPKKVDKAGLLATHADVQTTDTAHERHWHEIRALIEGASLPARVKERALKIFTKLAEAEANVHGTNVKDIHFHEVGGIDAIVDIVGTCAALESLNIDTVYCSAVAVGTGTITAAHGTLPNPGPATVKLLENAQITGTNQPYELTTPTGAAIVSALAENFGALPPMQNLATGYGAGTRDVANTPNVVQVVVGELTQTQTVEAMVMLETNVDDVTGEVLAHTIARLIDAGANDAWITPIVMKKGRAATTVSVLTTPARESALAALVTAETGSLGVRRWTVDRYAEPRRVDFVELDGQPVRVKVSQNRAKVEFDDALAIAKGRNVAVRQVILEAEQLWQAANSAR